MENNLNIFPTTIKYIKKFILNEECEEIIKYCKKIKLYNHMALIGNAKSNHGKHPFILNKINKKIYKKILNETNIYVKNIGLDKVIFTNSWINIQKSNSKLDKHCHPNSVVSGVLYLKTDVNSNKIYFYNPNPFISYVKIKELKENNYEYVYFKPEIGDLIIFPSWLMHGSNNDVNKSNERIALSFNTNYEVK